MSSSPSDYTFPVEFRLPSHFTDHLNIAFPNPIPLPTTSVNSPTKSTPTNSSVQPVPTLSSQVGGSDHHLPSIRSLNLPFTLPRPQLLRPFELDRISQSTRALPITADTAVASPHTRPVRNREIVPLPQPPTQYSPSSSRLLPIPVQYDPRDWITWVPPEAFRALVPEAVPSKNTPSQSGSLISDSIQSVAGPRTGVRTEDGGHRDTRQQRSGNSSLSPKSPKTSPAKALRLKPGGGRKKDFFPATRGISLAAINATSSSLPSPSSSLLPLPLPAQHHHAPHVPSTRAEPSLFTSEPLRTSQTPAISSTPAWGTTNPRKGSLAEIRRGNSDPSALMREYTRTRPTSRNAPPAFPFPVPQLSVDNTIREETVDERIEGRRGRSSVSRHSDLSNDPALIGSGSSRREPLRAPIERSSHSTPYRKTSADSWESMLQYSPSKKGNSPRLTTTTRRAQKRKWSPPSSSTRPPVHPSETSYHGRKSRHPKPISIPSPSSSSPPSDPSNATSFPNPNYSFRTSRPNPTPSPNYPTSSTVKATSIAEAARIGIGRELDRAERRRIYAENGIPIRGKGLVKKK